VVLALLAAGCATAQVRPPAAAPPNHRIAGAAADPASVQTVERWSPDVAAVLARLAAAPTVENELRVAQAYADRGIADQAHTHFGRAARLNPREGAAWDGLARIWRDWGYPGIGLGDAYRAVWAAPGSAAMHNTLGTILQYLGNGRAARAQFVRAIDLDPAASYAQNNLCYSWLMDADTGAATSACNRSIAIQPGLVPARNNLALAKAIDGDLAGAEAIFGAAEGQAAAQYNLGIVYLSQRRYATAATAFERASELQPRVAGARARARQARQYAADALETERGNHERR
jgi:Flp pilus assembly protein TadD